MMNFVDIILVILIAALVTLAVFFMIRSRKKGKSCCGNCSRCGGSTQCAKTSIERKE